MKDEGLGRKPVLILGNKIDRPNAVEQNILENALNLDEVRLRRPCGNIAFNMNCALNSFHIRVMHLIAPARVAFSCAR